MFVINIVAVISNLYVDVCAFLPTLLLNFFRVPLNVLVRTPGGYAYPRLGVSAAYESVYALPIDHPTRLGVGCCIKHCDLQPCRRDLETLE